MSQCVGKWVGLLADRRVGSSCEQSCALGTEDDRMPMWEVDEWAARATGWCKSKSGETTAIVTLTQQVL